MTIEEQKKNKIVAKTVREFCSNTTVHGFRYFTEKNLSWIERLWWAISITVLVILCTFATVNIWMGWQERPVVVSFDDKTTSIATIPFPAITICSTQMIDQNKLDVNELLQQMYSFVINGTDLQPDKLNRMNVLYQLCLDFMFKKFPQTLSCGSIYKSIENLTPAADITINQAAFDQKVVFFHPIFTERGLCYTFNSLNSRDIYSDVVAAELLTVDQNPNAPHWSIENGYVIGEEFPERVFGINSRDILTVYMGLISENIDSICSESGNRFHFALHSPDELPQIANDFMLIQSKQDVRVAVSPVLMKTSNRLRGYPPEIRGCFFKSERKLRFFKVYNQKHCEIECLANYIQAACECIPFYLPRDNSTRVCTLFDYHLYTKARRVFDRSQSVDKCNCLPDCISLTYNAISSQADLYGYEMFPVNENDSRHVISSKVTVLYKQPNFIGLTRSETGTLLDFVASFGGLLGLFMGVSIMSVVELVYYFTLRIFFKIRRERTRARVTRVLPASRIPRLTLTNPIIQSSDERKVAKH